MFVITTTGSDLFVVCESRTVAVAKARYFSQKYGRTFTVKSAQVDTDPFAKVEAPATSEPTCPKCGATGSDPCVTASGKKATKQHSGR